METIITFYDEENNEEIIFDVLNAIDIDGQRYVLVADEDDEATILKEIQMDDEEIIYELIEQDEEFQKIALLFMESEGEYSIEF